MYKKAWCTCRVVVLLIKPIVFLTFSLSSASLDLKVPNMRIGKWPSLGVASGQALHLRELWDSFMRERHKATRSGGKESLQWSLQNFHFCFAQMKQNTIAWKTIHHQLILIDDIPGWPAINTCYFWGLHGCIFTVRSQPRRIYKPANQKAEKGLPGKHKYYISPHLLCL